MWGQSICICVTYDSIPYALEDGSVDFPLSLYVALGNMNRKMTMLWTFFPSRLHQYCNGILQSIHSLLSYMFLWETSVSYRGKLLGSSRQIIKHSPPINSDIVLCSYLVKIVPIFSSLFPAIVTKNQEQNKILFSFKILLSNTWTSSLCLRLAAFL